MLKAFKYRLYPSAAQCELLERHFGCVRFVYNLALEAKKLAYLGSKVNVSRYDLQEQLAELKQDEKFSWLNEVNAQSLQYAIKCLNDAYVNFFKGKAEFPKFRKRSGYKSFTCPQNNSVDFDKQLINIIKFKKDGGIPIVISRKFSGDIRSVTISKTPTGKYFASILVETKQPMPAKKPVNSETTVGIDLGLKSFAVMSNGIVIQNPRHLKKSIERLRVLQRRASRKQLNSANRKKANLKVAIIHERIANQRNDFLHKLTTDIVKSHDTICLEDLNISGMIQNHNLAQAIADAGWSEFGRMLNYKTDWQGKNVLYSPRFSPTSKECGNCGAVNHLLKLADREWVCADCGTLHDRDGNASGNIRRNCLTKSGLGKTVEPVESLALAGAMKQEVSS